MSLTILQGDWIEQLRTLPDKSVHCCVTSPPYWGLRNYGVPGQLGLEKTPQEYVAKIVAGFREVYRVLRDDGTMWVNLGDCYATGAGKVSQCPGGGFQGEQFRAHFGKHTNGLALAVSGLTQPNRLPIPGLKAKEMVGIPWRVAFALQEAGWYLRSDIIWHKPNVMPESVTDRPTKAHEYIFLFSKSKRYYYDAEAIKEPCSGGAHARASGNKQRDFEGRLNHKAGGIPWTPKIPGVNPKANGPNSRMMVERANGKEHSKPNPSRSNIRPKQNASFSTAVTQLVPTRNKRTVWTVATAPYKGAHFATFPPKLIEPCILAGCPAGGTVLDPFAGSFTTAQVALDNDRSAIMIELNPDYIEQGKQRLGLLQFA